MKKIILSLIVLLSSFLVHAQKNYAIKVMDSKLEEPIVGAAIKIVSTNTIITTGFNGTAVINASPNDSLKITAKGYIDRQMSLFNQSTAISVILDAKPQKKATAAKKRKH